jgi:hypothetical protein
VSRRCCSLSNKKCARAPHSSARDVVICLPAPFVSSPTLIPFGLIFTRRDPATEVATDVVSHQIWGPRKRSWSLSMTILAGIMRNAGRHSNLVDIVRHPPFLFRYPGRPFRPSALLTFLVLSLGHHTIVPRTRRSCTSTTGCARYSGHLPGA